ncbi:nuclear transport factor 2 family protein [Rhizobium sp. LjRoot30]|uniref:nuclear transport factor 2 family protein n=1 Tax=Rhizobium sp. LjRoot30 TaxID=3342320 RepID=UPI003ECEF717
MASKEELIHAVQELYNARRAKDLDGLMSFTDPACSYRIVGGERLGAEATKVDDPEILRQHHEVLMNTWDFCNLQISSIHVDGDTVFVHHAGQVSFVPSGACFAAEFMDKITFRDGRVIDVVQFIDTLQAAKVMGIA